MNLLFDLTAAQPLQEGKMHGGGKYAEMLFFALCNRGVIFSTFYDSQKYISPQITAALGKYSIANFDINQSKLETIVSEHNIDVLYSAIPTRLFPFPGCIVLGTIHDLRPWEMPFDFFSNWVLDKGIIGLNTILASRRNFQEKFKADYLNSIGLLIHSPQFKFVTVSEYSKKIICKAFPDLDSEDIPVYYAPSTSCEEIQEIPITQDKPFFLLVSGNRPEKNVLRGIIALDKLFSSKQLSRDYTVKVTGLKDIPFKYSIRNPKQFDFVDYVDEEELQKLYRQCFAFIYPSLSEGFGYPPLEAMKYGKPVLASNRSSIPEICGNAAIFFNPTSIKEIQEAILSISHKESYDTFVSLSKKQYDSIKEKQDLDLEKMINWILNHGKTDS